MASATAEMKAVQWVDRSAAESADALGLTLVDEWVGQKAAMWAVLLAYLLNAMRVVRKAGKLAKLTDNLWDARSDGVWADSKGGQQVEEWVGSLAELSVCSMAGSRVVEMAGKMAL